MPSIVVIGASADRAKFGNKCVRAYSLKGYDVYPVNPNETVIEGRPAFKSILDVPIDRIDRVSVYLPPNLGANILKEVAQKKAAELWLNPGADGPEVVEKARQLGLNVIRGCSIVALGISPADLD
jgi:uncharacterized protein